VSVDRLTVIGLGLIGGSVAAAAKRARPSLRVRGVDPDDAAIGYAIEHGIIDEGADPEAAERNGWLAGDQGLVVLAAPVDATIRWLERLAETGFAGIATDVASTKRAVIAAAERHGGGYRFVGGHPMAGSERTGVASASATLFDGACYILTPTADTDIGAYRAVHAFVTSLGARVISLSAEEHDDAVAIISHVPHVAAAGLIALASERAESAGADVLRLAAGGFKDMTRIAAGSPDLWAGICLDNAQSVVAGIERLQKVLGDVAAAVSAGDAEAVRAWFARAAAVRRSLPAQWVPATSRLRELTVLVTDQPGAVSAVTTAVSRARCNIEDIAIEHRSEDSAVLRMVLTDEGDADALLADLEARGFSPQLRALDEENGTSEAAGGQS
jgi:prephenate dehydrogenase